MNEPSWMKKNLLKTLGPGILFASTAIGVSHLVQSTGAGAKFGFTMLWAVILANLFKYPFFEFGSRYANATGTSIIDGYRKLGRGVIWIFFLITFISMFLVTAAVGNVTGGFMQNLFGTESTTLTVAIVFVVCLILLISDSFKLLDSLIKVIAILLLISTLIAFFVVLYNGPQGQSSLWSMEQVDYDSYIGFLLPLMGWMPTAVDLSAWNSLWTVERIKQTGYHPKLKETLFDFNLGYIMSGLLAICFVTLGAFIMFGTNTNFAPGPAGFAAGVVDLYAQTFGGWATWVMGISAFSIMFGTCIAVFDGYSRAMSATLKNMNIKFIDKTNDKTLYRILLIIVSIGSFAIIYTFNNDVKGFKKLVDLATTVSFLMAPFVAIFNLILVRKKFVGEAFAPNLFLRILAYLGIIFLTIFSIFFIFNL